jgi:hypothetical protein
MSTVSTYQRSSNVSKFGPTPLRLGLGPVLLLEWNAVLVFLAHKTRGAAAAAAGGACVPL